MTSTDADSGRCSLEILGTSARLLLGLEVDAELDFFSYCNSILQCLYYTVPFRDQVINYPKRTPLDVINMAPNGLPRLSTHSGSTPNGQTPLSPTKAKSPMAPSSARNPGGPISSPKIEDKDAPDYKKKAALAKGPVINMNYDNTAAYDMQESLFTALKDVFEAIAAHHSRIGVVSPTRFLEVLRKENEMFRSLMHQDAHEFLNLLLNEVVANVEVNAKKLESERDPKVSDDAYLSKDGVRTPSNTGWVHELFEGTLTSETKCLTCENISQRDEVFLDLSVDLDQHSSVTSCLRKFSEEEMLCERNKFHCDRCGDLQEAEKRMKIKRLPKILALHLKRFKYTEDLQRLQKLFHRIVYPYHLRLFNTTDDAEDPDRLYELYAVVVHIGGGPYHGHYVSIIKTQDRGWLLFDDELVEPVDKSFVRNFFGDRPGLACAYVLFYQETTLEAVKREQDAERPAEVPHPPETPREPVGLGLRPNGASVNGPQSPLKTPVSSTVEEDSGETFEKVVTEVHQPSSDAATALPQIPQSKKERAREEKGRKAAEKEQERADRAKRKTLDLKRKETEKLKHVSAEVARSASEADDTTNQLHSEPTAIRGSHGGSNSGLAAGLNRFRQTSKSMSRRPKFWASNKDTSRVDESTIAAEGDETPPSSSHAAVMNPEKEKTLKHRFSGLIKKKPSMGL